MSFQNDNLNIVNLLGDLNGRLTALETQVVDNSRKDAEFQKHVMERLNVIHDEIEKRKVIQNWVLKIMAIVGPLIIGVISILEFYFQVI